MFAPNPESMAEAEAKIQELLTEEKVPELEFGGKISDYVVCIPRLFIWLLSYHLENIA